MSSYYEKILATGEVKCIDEEIPFEIPQGWEWCRICHVAEIARGGSPRPIKEYLTDATDGINWIKIGDTEKDSKYITSVKERIKQSGVSKSRMVHKGDFLLTNSMSFGRPYITQVDGCIHDGWLVISLIEQSYRQDFFYYLLSSGYAYSQFAKRVAGAVVQNLNSEKVAISLFPLPPYKEQNRIVQKIKDLLPLVEKFGNDKTLLDKLNADINTRLKKSILQEAIQGKLVPQIAEEGTAQELLEQIKKEKQKLVKEGKLKKSVFNNSVIFRGDDNKYYEQIGKKCLDITEQIPFEIPNSWTWARMGQVGDWGAGSTPLRGNQDYYGGNILWLKTGELNNDIVYDTEEKITQRAFQDCSLRMNKIGDVLIAMYGATIGKLAIVGKELTTNQACCGCTPYVVYNWFLFYFLMASRDSFIKKGEGGAQPNISRVKLVEHLIPLPPLNEQKRIVKRIETLFEQLH